MTKIQHENVVKLFEVHETPQTLFLVMEIPTGGELFDIIARATTGGGARKPPSILTAMHLHENGVAHRDQAGEHPAQGHDGGRDHQDHRLRPLEDLLR